MEATALGAAEVDGTVIGVTAPAVFPGRTGPKRSTSQEIVTDTIGLRIAHLVDAADATIALPGPMRLRYAARIASATPRGARMLLSTHNPWCGWMPVVLLVAVGTPIVWRQLKR